MAILRARLQNLFRKPIASPKYRKVKCSRGPAFDRRTSRLLASPREHLSRLAGNQTGSSLWREKFAPRKFFLTSAFSYCLSHDKQAVVCNRRCLITDIKNTPLRVNFHFRQDTLRPACNRQRGPYRLCDRLKVSTIMKQGVIKDSS